ncbi:aldose 1-epimerase [Oerskovia flava]|uniref:aldose 1-epimerase n=1 Tax=Oerskovia flava TaxID=2986422 RepID=UPI00223FE784|nr:aldose 1-epimerase [Oerskovia sp. JB1-3-2]
MTSASPCSNAYSDADVLDDLPTATLRSPSGAELAVALRGATVLAWRAPWRTADGQVHLADLVDGYADAAELRAQDASRSALMIPFANRVAGGTFTFDGARHVVPPVLEREPVTFHGFARVLDWEVEDPTTGSLDGPDGAARPSLALAARVRAGDAAGYPFDLDLGVRYTLVASGLRVRWSVRNVGAGDAPVTSGWHPYFRLPGRDRIDDLVLEVPARTAIVTDEDQIPLGGEAARVAIDGVGPLPLAGLRYDHAFWDLVPGPDGRARTRLTDPATGQGIEVWQTGGGMHVFTGDGLGPRARTSIALEPVSALTDAFNREDSVGAVRLAPGDEHVMEVGVDVVASVPGV